jgi:hypothetical protein
VAEPACEPVMVQAGDRQQFIVTHMAGSYPGYCCRDFAPHTAEDIVLSAASRPRLRTRLQRPGASPARESKAASLHPMELLVEQVS